jgi:hypothetical protein
MSLSAFGEKALMPNEEALAGTLKGSKARWDKLIEHTGNVCGHASGEWKYYSKNAGWSLVEKSGGRTILYLIPLDGSFKANFVLGEKAVAVVKASDLPAAVITNITEARAYAEGRPFMIDVNNDADASIAMRLIEIKSQN